MSPHKKKLIVNAFAMPTPEHFNPGLFKYLADKGVGEREQRGYIDQIPLHFSF
jgi:hypothetical protein